MAFPIVLKHLRKTDLFLLTFFTAVRNENISLLPFTCNLTYWAVLSISQSWERPGYVHVHTHIERKKYIGMNSAIQLWAWELDSNTLGEIGWGGGRDLHQNGFVVSISCITWLGLTHWFSGCPLFIVQTMNRKEKISNTLWIRENLFQISISNKDALCDGVNLKTALRGVLHLNPDLSGCKLWIARGNKQCSHILPYHAPFCNIIATCSR